MLSIFKKEFKHYFTSMLGWIVLFLFFAISGVMFFIVLLTDVADTSGILYLMMMCGLVVAPLLTMRLLSEEKRQKTDQLLLTAPVKLSSIVMGKFWAATAVYGICLSMSLVYTFIVSIHAEVAWGVILYGVFGLAIGGMALIALGLLMSSVTESQIIALISSLGIMVVIFLMSMFGTAIDIPWVQGIVTSLSFFDRYISFLSGIVNISDILFYISFAVVFNFLTVRVLEKKRWS